MRKYYEITKVFIYSNDTGLSKPARNLCQRSSIKFEIAEHDETVDLIASGGDGFFLRSCVHESGASKDAYYRNKYRSSRFWDLVPSELICQSL